MASSDRDPSLVPTFRQSDLPPDMGEQSQAQGLRQTPTSTEALTMTSLAMALPVDTSQNYVGQRYPMGDQESLRSISMNPYDSHQMLQYQGYPQAPGQAAMNMQYPPYMDHQAMGVPYSPVQGHYGAPNMYGSPQTSPQYGNFPPGFGTQMHGQHHSFQGQHRVYQGLDFRQSGNPAVQGGRMTANRSVYSSQSGAGSGYQPASPSVPSAPRGPPRKPKQSGHALWVGNLPPGTQVADLKDHFSRDATKDIESVFLISKSNCAFVNYRSEAACVAAMTRFHDSRFQGVRLVCRLRKGPGSISSPTGAIPVAPSGPAALQTSSTQLQSAVDAITQNRELSAKATEAAGTSDQVVNDKYFIVKSLTIEDLELSVRNGIWATQGHNEEALNKAYETVDNVFLVFSANKSGEYFGYARMESPINDEAAKDLEWKPFRESQATETIADPELPRSISTSATEFAPKGRIIDDSARGTIFWEADTDSDPEVDGVPDVGEVDGVKVDGRDSSEDETEVQGRESNDAANLTGEDAGHQTFGRPFRVRWVSTVKLPFYRTRGLRNPWNANREVKIARDGTELETSVGRRLVAMFHRVPVPQQMQSASMQGQQALMGQPPPQMGYGMGPMSPGRY